VDVGCIEESSKNSDWSGLGNVSKRPGGRGKEGAAKGDEFGLGGVDGETGDCGPKAKDVVKDGDVSVVGDEDGSVVGEKKAFPTEESLD